VPLQETRGRVFFSSVLLFLSPVAEGAGVISLLPDVLPPLMLDSALFSLSAEAFHTSEPAHASSLNRGFLVTLTLKVSVSLFSAAYS